MTIYEVDGCNRKRLWQIGKLLHESFPHAYGSEKRGFLEAESLTEGDYIVLVSVDDADDSVLGIVAAKAAYGHTGWEMHPLAVKKSCRRQGIGRALVMMLEKRLESKGCVTLYFGADDEFGETTVSNVDLYEDIPKAIKTIENKKDHALSFYQQLGYRVVGLIPDANGIGKPDIMMAKRMKLQKR